ETVGCKTAQVTPAEHDQLVCRASHLPHILATALVHHVLGEEKPKIQAKVCASGFRDTTRVASGSPEMWRDIVLNNRGPIIREIEAYIETLQRLKTTLNSENSEDILDVFSRARELRNDWLDQRSNGWNS
ncbi:MAG: prephenate dehydrogenase/arogenate dehydrogenase family protein, partial [Verrucomicrobia bacterium]|nr:prephenate dehydrogenase/arogenate dehydrogenase family protein [Verrucomicrobiota bacterium]